MGFSIGFQQQGGHFFDPLPGEGMEYNLRGGIGQSRGGTLQADSSYQGGSNFGCGMHRACIISPNVLNYSLFSTSSPSFTKKSYFISGKNEKLGGSP